MKHLSEYRDSALAQRLAAEVRALVTRPWAIMEVCGGQTHAILRHGLDQLLPEAVTLIHGPGCPVCVTPVALIDRALTLAAQPGVTFCSFGDMLRVPGSSSDLLAVKSQGADVRIVYAPLDAVELARSRPERQVIFFGIGFETTAPANALAVLHARRLGLTNFSMLISHVLVPPALAAVLSAPGCKVNAILAAGHVCTVMGWQQYPALAARHRVPIVITGFEPLDILEGIRRAVRQLEAGEAVVENAYPRVVSAEGNFRAQAALAEVFEVCDREWRGLGVLPASGLRLRASLRDFDAEQRFPCTIRPEAAPPSPCRSGEVLQGLIRPPECAAFGAECTPRTPLGATMVSSEGACAAYFHYGRLKSARTPASREVCP
ncbi:MAG TPA: hydrogenase formation protein HypD [Gemmatales bacterium]|nr:hydrogenase formation protein HypD [Gemmatales bacterium]HMP60604.1 hydrogenase formation protein HypD [Gemmatales bacterium]